MKRRREKVREREREGARERRKTIASMSSHVQISVLRLYTMK